MNMQVQPRDCRKNGCVWGIMVRQLADGRRVAVCAYCQMTREERVAYEAKRREDAAAWYAALPVVEESR